MWKSAEGVGKMAELVLGVGASHTTLMNTQWERVDHLPQAHAFRDALQAARERLAAAKPDLVVIVGSNHFRGQWLDLMPSFLIGVDEIQAGGEHGTPKGRLPSHPQAAQFLCGELLGAGFDLAFSTRLTVDHGVTHAVQWLLGDTPAPIVPLVINCFAPPLPTLSRTMELGDALGAALRRLPSCRRVAVIGSGGLSHRLPFPDWRNPQSEDDRFLVDSWRNGRGNWRRYEGRRRTLVLKTPPVINESFDQDFLRALGAGQLRRFAHELADADLQAQAGNGGNEVRTWLVMAAALGCRPAQVLNYAPVPEWLTGMAVALIAPPPCDRPPGGRP